MRLLVSTVAFVAALAASPVVFAHAFPDRSSPRVGATVATAPQEVKIWFDGQIEPVFSTLFVKNAAGHRVSVGQGHVDSKNPVLLETKLPKADPLPAGKYTVYWSVIAHDGHHTEGHFSFTVG